MKKQSITNNARILIVDDEEDLLQALAFTLKRNGHVVTGCTNGEKALKYIKETLNTGLVFDLALLGIPLAGMTGLALMDVIGAMDIKLPIIVMSNYGTYETNSYLKNKEYWGCLVKPFSSQSLISIVSSIMKENLKKGNTL